MSYNAFLVAIFIVIITQNGKTDALLKVSMDDMRSIINVDNPTWGGSSSSGILKSHFGFSYTTGRNKTLILSAPKGYSMLASIRLLDFRPNSQDILMLYSYNYSQPPASFFNKYFFRHKIISSQESTTYYVPNGQLGVTFLTAAGNAFGYDGFQLTFTVQSYMICNNGVFRCWNGRCIANSLRCDGHNHCGDRSDQLTCSNDPPRVGRITGIIFGVVFLLIAVSCAIFIIVRKATRSRTEAQTIVSQPVTTYPPPQGYPPSYVQPGAYYPPPPPPYSQGVNNLGYH